MFGMESPRRTGRRPGPSDTREAIARAARMSFASQGYERTSIRSVATTAGVDPALIMRFYGSKQELFKQIVELPFDPGEVLPTVIGKDHDTAGERVAQFVVGIFADEEALGRLLAIVRVAASEPSAAELVRQIITERVLAPVVKHLGSSDAELRAALVSSQIVGLLQARYVVGLSALVDATDEQLVRALAPNLQRYLTGDLGATPPA